MSERDLNLTYVRDDNDPTVYYVFDATLRGTQWDAQPVETGAVTREGGNRWLATPLGGGHNARLLTRESAAHHLRARAENRMRATKAAEAIADYPEQADCRCAAHLAITGTQHRTVHDVNGTDCPCVCHPANPRPAEKMTPHSQFDIHALAVRATQSALRTVGIPRETAAHWEDLATVRAWCTLTGMPRAAALHLAAEIANREQLIAVVAPF